VAVAAGAVGLLVAFALVERRATDPLLGPALLRRPGMLSAGGVALVLTATTTPPMLFCTLHAQGVLGLDPAVAGLLFPPFNLSVVAGSLAGPRVVAVVGERRAMVGGLLAVACGALALRAIGQDVPALPSMLGGFVLLGAGLGVASVASTTLGTAASDPARRGVASGLLITSAQVGNVLGIAVLVPLAAARSAASTGTVDAQVAGYELGFTAAAVVAGATALAVALAGRRRRADAGASGLGGGQRSDHRVDVGEPPRSHHKDEHEQRQHQPTRDRDAHGDRVVAQHTDHR
jgi:MFS family permease